MSNARNVEAFKQAFDQIGMPGVVTRQLGIKECVNLLIKDPGNQAAFEKIMFENLDRKKIIDQQVIKKLFGNEARNVKYTLLELKQERLDDQIEEKGDFTPAV